MSQPRIVPSIAEYGAAAMLKPIDVRLMAAGVIESVCVVWVPSSQVSLCLMEPVGGGGDS